MRCQGSKGVLFGFTKGQINQIWYRDMRTIESDPHFWSKWGGRGGGVGRWTVLVWFRRYQWAFSGSSLMSFVVLMYKYHAWVTSNWTVSNHQPETWPKPHRFTFLSSKMSAFAANARDFVRFSTPVFGYIVRNGVTQNFYPSWSLTFYLLCGQKALDVRSLTALARAPMTHWSTRSTQAARPPSYQCLCTQQSMNIHCPHVCAPSNRVNLCSPVAAIVSQPPSKSKFRSKKIAQSATMPIQSWNSLFWWGCRYQHSIFFGVKRMIFCFVKRQYIDDHIIPTVGKNMFWWGNMGRDDAGHLVMYRYGVGYGGLWVLDAKRCVLDVLRGDWPMSQVLLDGSKGVSEGLLSRAGGHSLNTTARGDYGWKGMDMRMLLRHAQKHVLVLSPQGSSVLCNWISNGYYASPWRRMV